MNTLSPTLISLAGPTGVGKTALSIALAEKLNAEIISVDSRQFYKGMDIGTAKISEQERKGIPHHFLDFLSPNENYNAGQFEREANLLLENLFQKHTYIIAVGGSTLYLNALWHGIDEIPDADMNIREELNKLYKEQGLAPLQAELAAVDPDTWAQIDTQNHIRIIRALEIYRTTGTPISVFRKKEKAPKPWQHLKFVLDAPREDLYKRIDERVLEMVNQGLLAEVNGLLQQGYSADLSSMQAIGYKEICDFIAGKSKLPEAIRLIQQHSRNYAKRQLTWFRRETDVHWLQAGNTQNLAKKVLEKLT